jgi:hypothetical protein
MRSMTFFKSISLAEDLSVPLRASHYRPTSKSIDILRAILGMSGSQATSVVATYGSGKSIAAMVASLLVGAEPEKLEALEPAYRRILKFAPEIADWMRGRLERQRHGSVITLSGHVPDLPTALGEAVGLRGVQSMADALRGLEGHLSSTKADRLAIVWDEFGRHLETLAGRGRAEDLAQLQDLAEWTTRRKAPPATLTLLLHQDFHRYSGRLGQSDQSGWRKIEGRFDILRIIEDSDEIYDLIADVAQELTRTGRPRVSDSMLTTADALNFFPFAAGKAMRTLLSHAAPLSPTAFYLLPRIAGRIGQGERTIFGFLGTELPEDRAATVTVEDLYRHFADAMRADTAIGGTHKRFVETEAARARANTPLEREIIATTSLMHLAATGDSARVGRERLVQAMDLGSMHPRARIEEAIDALLSRKLLLHRTLTDEISVWEGSDVDVRTRAQEEMNALRTAGDPLDRVRAHVPAPHYVGEAYNHDRALTRYAQGVFVDAAMLTNPETQAALLAQADASDALVALVVDASVQDADKLCGSWMDGYPHLIVALASQSPDLHMASLEADAYARLESDELLLEMDPRVAGEIAELKGDILDFLLARASSLIDPAMGEVYWYSQGERLGGGPDLRPGEVMSAIFEERYPLTPRIVNEQIVRRKVTAQTKSARKRLLLGILERSDVSHMGYEGLSTSDASLFRTTLVTPGLFDADRAVWVEPDDLNDRPLAATWRRIADFYDVPQAGAKPFSSLIDELTAPPFGLRAGVLPILLTAGLRAFARTVAIRQKREGKWVYLDDIVPSTMEAIADDPDAFEIEVIKMSTAQRDRIERLIGEFSVKLDRVETDLVRAFHDAFEQWKRALPKAALSARGLGSEAEALQTAIRKTRGDPAHLLLRAFPDMAGTKSLNDKTVEVVSAARKQLERVTDRYADEAIGIIRSAFGGTSSDALEAAATWASLVPAAIFKDATIDRVALAITNRARKATSGADTERSFARALSAMLLGLDFEEWDDNAVRDFSQKLKVRIREIEEAILSADDLGKGAAPFLGRVDKTLSLTASL